MNNNWVYFIVLLLVTIGLGVGIGFRYNHDVYEDVTTEQSCSNSGDKKKTCGIWEDNICLKGKCSSPGNCTTCDKPADVLFVVMCVFVLISFIMLLVFLVRGVRHKDNTSLNFGFSDDSDSMIFK
jgi:disulfide bond formation protein DsbB